MPNFLLIILAATAAGVVTALVAVRLLAPRAARDEEEQARELEALLERLKGSFAILSQEALGRSVDELLKLARETLGTRVKEGERDLEGKKQLIDQTLKSMASELDKVRTALRDFEKERIQQYGSLTTQLRSAGELTARLEQTTGRLAAALASSRQRGQWGERMAEDVLRLAAFKEGIQYTKQQQVEGAATRPDYTFFLPHELVVNMDVKFPLDNYLKCASAPTEAERDRLKAQFMRDVQNRIKEVTGREYINPEARTVDYVLVFIPNEQVYAFIWENDPTLVDRALEKKVLLCSPVTLLAILGIIRQAVENFNMEKTAAEILSLLGVFAKQWEKFAASMEKVGKRIGEAQEEYERLVSTRRTALERPLRKIDELRQNRGIEIAALPPGDAEDGEGDAPGAGPGEDARPPA